MSAPRPRLAWIGPYRWLIDWHDGTTDTNLGFTDYNNMTLRVRTDQCEQSAKDTFLHEAMHAMLWVSGLHHRLASGEAVSEEEMCGALAPYLFAFMRDNGGVTKWLNDFEQ